MKEKLQALLQNSQSNYYHFKVAAIIITKDNKEYKGVNVETSSPGAGICAERNALYSALSDGYKTNDFKELHIMADSSVKPCFICRQALIDFTNQDMPIYLYSKEGFDTKLTVKDLTPYPFADEDLK